MMYLGLDVHLKSTVWCLLDQTGEIAQRGKVRTTVEELATLVARLSADTELLAGQEVGKLSYLVHDVLTTVGVKLLSFNAYQMRMIASSRKKTDKRDAYWIAKALQTGMMPHPVFIPTGEVRELRGLLATRAALISERKRWTVRASCALTASGATVKSTAGTRRWLDRALESVDGIEGYLGDRLELCERMHAHLSSEIAELDQEIRSLSKGVEAIQRLQTIPAVGPQVAVTIYAWVGDVSRFPNARALASYAGLVPSVRQSGSQLTHGHITGEGSKPLRSTLIQAGHVLLWRCQSNTAAPLRALAERVKANRGRRKIAVVAAARHILKIAFYVLRDETSYNPALLRPSQEVQQAAG